jgi:hypothetical protein
MQLPIINICGTDQQSLLDQYMLAIHALREAIEALGAASPNGRDYQQGGSINTALQEHAIRVVKVRQVLAEIETIAEHLA